MIYIDSTLREPMYMQIYRCIKEEILAGERNVKDKLPPIRELAVSLNVSKNTVETAYHQLLVEGYVKSRRGSGFVIEDVQNFLLSYRKINEIKDKNAEKKWMESLGKDELSEEIQYDFQYGNISSEYFPYDYWRKAAEYILSSYETLALSSYVSKMGDLKLREVLSRYLYEARGISCHAEQIIISSGFSHAMNIICDILPKTHRKVGMEEPGFYSARDIFNYRKFEIEPLRLFPDNQYFYDLKNTAAKCLYVTPSHQFPMGMVMPIDIRYRLLRWAVKNDGYLIEDDYDSTLRYNSRPIPALFSLDESDRVFYVGTFSKSLSPAIRVNYLVLPERFVEKYKKLPQYSHSTVSWLDQKILAKFIEDGGYYKHLRKISTQYSARSLLLKQLISKNFGNAIKLHGFGAGLHMVLEVNPEIDADRLITLAREKKVAVYSAQKCFYNKEKAPKNLLLLGFGKINEDEIKKGVELLKNVWGKM